MAVKTNCIINGIKYFKKTKTIGHRSDGSPIKKLFYGKSEKEANQKIEEFMNLMKRGVPIDFYDITVEQLMYSWLWNVLFPSIKTKSASFEKHEGNYRLYIKDKDIGHLTVYDICTQPIQLYYNKLYNTGVVKKNRKGEMELTTLTTDKIFDINKTLRKFFNYCRLQHYIIENPCSLERIEIPGDADDFDEDEVNDIQVFSDEEMKIIRPNLKIKGNEDNTIRFAIQLDFISGLRRGELFALTKRNIDLENCKIKVRKTLSRVKVFTDSENYYREIRLKSPKTPCSIRDVDFPPEMIPLFMMYFQEQEKKYFKLGIKFNDDSLLFTTESCKPIDPSNFYRTWQKFLKDIKVNFKKPHSIRDTYATTLFRNGAKLTDVRDLLGQSSITTTEKYYIFVFPADKKETVKLITCMIA